MSAKDQSKTTFTCPFGTYAYRCMPFGLCNAPATFQRCMTAIFSDFCGKIVEVFMDDFSVYGTSFDDCLSNLDRAIIKRGSINEEIVHVNHNNIFTEVREYRSHTSLKGSRCIA